MRNIHFSNFYFFYFTTIGVIVPYWGLYLSHLDFSAMQIGELMAILLLTKVIAPNVWAAIADRATVKHGNALSILRFATLMTLICYLTINYAQQYWSMAMGMFAFCVFWNACVPQMEAATLNQLDNKREKYGEIRLWGSIGFIVTVLVVGALIDKGGPQLIFPAGAVSMLLMCLSCFWLVHRASKQRLLAVVDLEQMQTKIALTKLLNKRVNVLLLLCFFMQMSHSPFYTFYSIYLESYGYSKFLIGILWSSGVVFEIVIFLIGFRLLRRFELGHLLTFTFFVASVRWCLVASMPENSAIMFVAQMMHALTYGLYHIVMIQLIDQSFVGRYQIRGQALYSSITFGLGGALGSVMSGYIWTYYGQAQLFWLAGLMMFFVAICSLILLHNKPHEELISN
ncbi:MAG: MFS transporter [Acidiferrobacterales bacterium]|nr:MFS transporter [Acidiferrobacterales bacterium]